MRLRRHRELTVQYCTWGEHIVVGMGMRYSLTGGGGERSGPRTTHDATHLRSTHGRGAPEESELTQLGCTTERSFACDWCLHPLFLLAPPPFAQPLSCAQDTVWSFLAILAFSYHYRDCSQPQQERTYGIWRLLSHKLKRRGPKAEGDASLATS
jgi:hypothetical protein